MPPSTAIQPRSPEHEPEDNRAGQTPVASIEVGRFLVLQRFLGACDATTAELFFDNGREPGRAIRNRQQAAKAICGLCPILSECSLVGRTDLTLEGIWGGETRTERRGARRRAHGQPIPAVPPGNPAGRLRVQQAHQHARRFGVHRAADRLAIPAATLRRLLTLYDLDQHSGSRTVRLVGAGVHGGG
jgi:WhiB family transcriptional regulator, redox-sensing transcriptional regulator